MDADGGCTEPGRNTRNQIEALTDVLSADEFDELIGLEPIAAAVEAAHGARA